ncbi:hypothetical protein PVAP13_6KG353206 [Panicum virgatum]|uniref:Uncharacterized protein n=1 Tax=Panicum virgatum TaxID=38727 RepID=A0A8T0RJT0_PANVG|nr:hypothetical protein PVAP13_6KG353206 [Panicum virgatum]
MDVLGAHQPLPVAPSYSDSDLDRVPPVTVCRPRRLLPLCPRALPPFFSAPARRRLLHWPPAAPARNAAAPRRAVPVPGRAARNTEAVRVRAARNVSGSVPGRCRCACRAEHGCSALRLPPTPPTPPPRLQQLLQLLDAATPVPRRCADRGTLLSTRLGKHFSFYTTPL